MKWFMSPTHAQLEGESRSTRFVPSSVGRPIHRLLGLRSCAEMSRSEPPRDPSLDDSASDVTPARGGRARVPQSP